MPRAKTVDGVIVSPVFRLTKRIHAHMTQARARHGLGVLNDHLLRDLGLTRAEIDYVARGRRRP